jgi:hypothetical protein
MPPAKYGVPRNIPACVPKYVAIYNALVLGYCHGVFGIAFKK